jgi:hypothetical protein
MVAALLLASARVANAQPAPQSPPASAGNLPTVELDYQVEAGLTCPTADQLRADVAKEMEYDAFGSGVAPPMGRFHVIVSREHGQRRGVLLVRLSFDDATDKQAWGTDFEGVPATARTCDHLVRMHAVDDMVTHLTVLLARQARRAEACPASKPGPAGSTPGPMCPPATTLDIWPPELPLPPLRAPRPDPPKPPERWPFALRSASRRGPSRSSRGWARSGSRPRSARATAPSPRASRCMSTRRSDRSRTPASAP